MNSNNEYQQITKKLEEIKAQNDVQQKNFTDEIAKVVRKVLILAEDQKSHIEEINAKIIQFQDRLKIKGMLELENQKLKEKLESKSHMEDEFLKSLGNLHMDLRQKERSIQELVESYTKMTIKERESIDELQKDQKNLIMAWLRRTHCGIRRIIMPIFSSGRRKFSCWKCEYKREGEEVWDMNMSEELAVHPDCRNASNRFHECSDYCFRVMAEAKIRMEQQESVQLNSAFSRITTTKVTNSDNEHQQITKTLEEIKALNDVQQKSFADEIQKNKKQISSLEIALMKLKVDYRKVLTLPEDQKRQIEELNAKNIQLQDQLKIKEMLELENQKLKEKVEFKSHMEDEFLKSLGDLHMDLRRKEKSLQELVESYTKRTIKEHEKNGELQDYQNNLIMEMTKNEVEKGIAVKNYMTENGIWLS